MKTNIVDLVGNVRGQMKTKEHRAAKLIASWGGLRRKFEAMAARGGGFTPQSRLAFGMLVMMETGIRVGNEGSAEGWVCENQIIAKKDNPEKGIKVGDVIWQHPMFGKTVATYGLTTLKNRHVKIKNGKIIIRFTGKKLVDHKLVISNVLLVQIATNIEQYNINQGAGQMDKWLGFDYPDLFKFTKKYVGKKYSPKDIRTAKVNRLFCQMFVDGCAVQYEQSETKSERKKLVMGCIEACAEEIGHTKGVCKSSYLSSNLTNVLLNAAHGIGYTATFPV